MGGFVKMDVEMKIGGFVKIDEARPGEEGFKKRGEPDCFFKRSFF
jgi:hypothetical protein